MNKIPVTLICGFLESGKTTYLNKLVSTLPNKEKLLIIQCEDGEQQLIDSFIPHVMIEYLEDFNRTDLQQLTDQYHPERIIIEANGMWPVQNIHISFPLSWNLEEMISIIDASTFEQYQKNIGSLMMEKIRYGSKVLFNRVNEENAQMLRKKNLRLVSSSKEIYLYFADHYELYDNGQLRPAAFQKPEIEIDNNDFGYWFADYSADNSFYEGKTITLQGGAVLLPELREDEFVIGRSAMVCCASDMVFIGMLCKNSLGIQVKNGSWIKVKGQLKKYNSPQIPYYIELSELCEVNPPENVIVNY